MKPMKERRREKVLPFSYWQEQHALRAVADAQYDFWCQVGICALLLKFDSVLSWWGGVLPFIGRGARLLDIPSRIR